VRIFCVSLPRPGPRLRAVIIIVIYLGAFRLAPNDSVPLALGGFLGSLLAAQPIWATKTGDTQECAG
jgi:hypothetical protein